jgi:AraC-like DNA-binding protein
MIKSGFNLDSINTSISIYMGIFMIACILSYSVYLYLSFKLLRQHQQAIPNYFSYREKITLSWIRNLLIIMLVFWFSIILFLVLLQGRGSMDWYMEGLMLFSIVAIFYMGTMGILQPRVYHQIGFRAEKKVPPSNTSSNEGKYRKSALSPEMMERILTHLEQLMDSDKPYLKNNLTLPELSEMLAVSPNYLSQVINEKLQMNFFDYINSYRIEVAKQLLIKPLPYTHTILDIAMESAFNSKSAFYSSFKKQTGLTPVQYKKAVKKNAKQFNGESL